MDIHSSIFIKSSDTYKSCPQDKKPEYAFTGRSNVGKSTLINYLTNKKKLAKTSEKPGKTQLINHFLINDQWYLVDLPGYGYAKTSKTKRHEFNRLIKNYLLKRTNLVCLFLLIDSRHEPMENDLRFMEWLGINQVPFVIVFTKKDKIKDAQLENNINQYKKELLKSWETLPELFATSSLKKAGKEEILSFIHKWNRQISL